MGVPKGNVTGGKKKRNARDRRMRLQLFFPRGFQLFFPEASNFFFPEGRASWVGAL